MNESMEDENMPTEIDFQRECGACTTFRSTQRFSFLP